MHKSGNISFKFKACNYESWIDRLILKKVKSTCILIRNRDYYLGITSKFTVSSNIYNLIYNVMYNDLL